MFKRVIASLSVGAVLCLGTESGVAHHSVLINFDRQAVTEVSGTVSAVYLRNPHSQYVLDVTEDDGSVTEWFIEWADRNALTRRGVDLDLIQVGDEVTIIISRIKCARRNASFRMATACWSSSHTTIPSITREPWS